MPDEVAAALANLGKSATNPAGGKAMRELVKDSKSFVQMLTEAFKDIKVDATGMGKEMNKSFQGMAAQASIAQKIIGGTMDFFAIGVSKTQKEFVGALKKMFSEGDIAGGIDALVNMKYQFVDLKQLAGPFQAVFGPFNKMLEAVAGFATQYIVNSAEFQQFIADAFSPEGIATLERYGKMFGELVMKFVNMDWEAAVNAIYKLMEGVGNFINWIVELQGNWQNFADRANRFWNVSPAEGGGLNALG